MKTTKDKSNEVFEILKKRYADSDVTEGDFIIDEKFKMSEFSQKDVEKGAELFLKWGESEYDIEVIFANGYYIIIEKGEE